MAYVITHGCCKDASCVPVCPVDCIRPADDDGRPMSTDMLYIDPDTCIDCGACMEECPVDAIYPDDELPERLGLFADINAEYFQRHPLQRSNLDVVTRHAAVEPGELRVAIVGAGPAACYAAVDLIAVPGVEVNLFERLPTPYGLIRAGVAPDHQATKGVVRVFEHALANYRMQCYLNTEIGTTVTHDDLAEHHHAVIYATGANAGRALGIPGETLPGVFTAAEFVNWYNGHPDHAHHTPTLDGRRAVIIGNGNVALDIARILMMDPQQRQSTDIAEYALHALNNCSFDEVQIIGRRGLRDAAFSVGEFAALGDLDGVEVYVEADDLDPRPGDDLDSRHRILIAQRHNARHTHSSRRIRFVFNKTPAEFSGNGKATGIALRSSDQPGGRVDAIDASLLITSIGYCSSPIPGIPHDEQHGLIPNEGGRVTCADGARVHGVYTTGWAKRGPRGVVGTNRTCAAETVAHLLADFDAGILRRDLAATGDLASLLHARGARPLSYRDWGAIDMAERRRGIALERPRIKITAVEHLLAAARMTD